MGVAILVKDADFEREVLKSDLPVVVDFFADWCGPCVRMAPIIEEIAQEFAGKVKVCKLDVVASNATATKYNILSIPTLIFFKNGQVVERSVGALTKDQLRTKLNAFLGAESSSA